MNKRLAVVLFTVTGSRLLLLGLWFTALIVFYKSMGRSEAGLAEAGMFGTCIAFIKVITACIGDSLDLAVLRRTPILLIENRLQALKVFRASLVFRVAIALVIGMIVVALASPISELLFQNTRFRALIWISVAGLMGELLFRYVLVFFQANEKFSYIVLLEAILQVGRFGVIIYLVYTEALGVYSALTGYVVVSYVVAIIGIFLLPRDLANRNASAGLDELADIFHYAKWMVAALIVAALYERLDLFMVSSFHGTVAAGLYSGLLTLAMIPEVVGGFLSTVLQPKVVGLYRDNKFRSFQRSFFKLFIPLGLIAGIIVLVFGRYLVDWTLGDSYLEALTAFKLLSVGLLFWLVTTPLSMALVALVTPKKILQITLVQLSLMVAGGLILVPPYGYTGAAILILSVRTLIALWLMFIAGKIVQHRPALQELGLTDTNDSPSQLTEPDGFS